MITGAERRIGSLTIGDTVQMGYVDQSRDSLDDDKSVWRKSPAGMILMLGKIEKPSRAYVGSFNFKAKTNRKGRHYRVGSGTAHLAKMLQGVEPAPPR